MSDTDLFSLKCRVTLVTDSYKGFGNAMERLVEVQNLTFNGGRCVS